jgi:hypothetical protein
LKNSWLKREASCNGRFFSSSSPGPNESPPF